MEDSSIFSQSSKDVSSAISLYNMPTGEDASIRGMLDYDPNDEAQSSGISRPLSRSSVTSSLSMVATKDGIEGRRVHRYGIPQYSLNLLDAMSQPPPPKGKPNTRQSVQNNYLSPQEHKEDFEAQLYQDSMHGPPITLKEKMQLLRDNSESSHLDYSEESYQEGSTSFSGKDQLHSLHSFKRDVASERDDSDGLSH
ncbi:LAQU0S09e01618g1_1 [Lachancea quebecensis]|uniref:LAQU0S09e01618g1_1 n=1 Tax=Lachancea quebecensis TaxID=1654605 RepID=A0A0P1KTX2_9SACH|nr:LAQU0S09e01618g1_1 [Lachancea quebecensis]